MQLLYLGVLFYCIVHVTVTLACIICLYHSNLVDYYDMSNSLRFQLPISNNIASYIQRITVKTHLSKFCLVKWIGRGNAMYRNSVATTDYILANFATNLTPYSDFCPVKFVQDANFEYRQQFL